MDRYAGTLATRVVAAAGAAVLVSTVGFPGVVSAGLEALPTAEVTTTSCSDEGGIITVNITDSSSETYDVLLDGEVVPGGDNITDTDEGEEPVLIGPLADGTYNVQVLWNENPEEGPILDEDVAIDCVPDAPETTTPPAAPGPETAPVVAAPNYTG